MGDQEQFLSHPITPTPSVFSDLAPTTPLPDLLSPLPRSDDSQYVQRTDAVFLQQFQEITTGAFENILAQLTSATDPRLKHPFVIRGFREQGLGSISVNPANYQNTLFRVATEPQSGDGVIYRRVEFGYTVRRDFRRIGVLSYILLDPDDTVLEVGFGSQEAKDVFLHHLFGRTLSEEMRERIRIVQEELFAYLRTSPLAQEKLREFATSRHWPAGLEEIANLAYFDNWLTPLEEFAEQKGFSKEDLYLAGWYDLAFTQKGLPSYSIRDSKVIRIPYFRKNRIELWRTRNLRPARTTSHKYTSWPLDRSIDRAFGVEEKLYYGWDLDKARGQTLVLTEGEFKCLVATQASSILTVGIPGITEVDEVIIQALVEAEAAEYVVILDRDPRGKGFMRVDGITDSERAAYSIALDLLRTGAKNVRVGRIPDVKQGQKVGIDDLILEQGVGAYMQVIHEALPPQEYAEAIGLNETFCLLLSARQRIRKAVEQYEWSARRGGAQVDEAIYAEALRLRDEIGKLYSDYLLERFRGAYRINQPSRENAVLFWVSGIEDAEKKIVVAPSGEGIGLEHFQGDIIFFHYFPADIPREHMWSGKNDLLFPMSMEAITRFFQTTEYKSDDFSLLFQRGLEVLGKPWEEGQPVPWRSVHDIGLILLAGYISYDFPVDEFIIIPNLTFYIDRGTHWEEHVRIPLTVFRKSYGDAVAFITLTTWEEGDGQPEDSEELPEASNAVVNALMHDSRMMLFASSFLRQRNAVQDELKFRMVVETLYPYWFERKKKETLSTMANLGVGEAMVEQCQLLELSPADYQELIAHFVFRRLLNQATNSGLFRQNDHAKIVPRFHGSVILLPVFDESRNIISLRVLPLTLEDHLPPMSDPSQKLIRQIDGGDRHLLKNLDPVRHLYLQERLRGVRGKRLVITLHELDGLILGAQERHVVGLNSSLAVHPSILAKIYAAAPASICFVLSGQIPSSQYDLFQFDAPSFLKDLYDVQEAINASRPDDTPPISVEFTVLPFPLTHLAAQHSISEDTIFALFASCANVQAILDAQKFNPALHGIVQRFLKASARLLDYLEIQALPDLLDARPIEWWVRESKRLYAVIQQYAHQAYRMTLPDVDVYMQEKLHLAEPRPIEELIRLRKEEGAVFLHKPLYSLERTPPAAVSGELVQLFRQTLIERTEVRFQDIQNVFPQASVPQGKHGKKGRSIASALQEKHGEEKHVIASGQPPETEEHARPTRPNAKGELLQFHQRSPDRFSRPEVIAEEHREGLFTLTVRMNVQDRLGPLTGTGCSSRKKEAEALACERILQQLQNEEPPPAKPEKDLMANPKGAVYELLQKMPPPARKPSIHSRQVESGFEVAVSLQYQGQRYTGQGKGKTKREAEREAFSLILEQLYGPQTVSGLAREEAAQLEQALQMGAGNKNYVGRVYAIAQLMQARPPEFLTTFHLVEEGIEYQTEGSLQLREGILLTSKAHSLIREKSKQQAALDILSQLSGLVNQGDVLPETLDS